ncbi:P-loop containing nucleoside triphosphate hydrolase protein [Rhypophila sp. PSN 637]
MADPKAIIVGISGCSSSGKTTLARLLRDIFPNTFILHEDDFYKAEDQLPIKDGLVDWDCPEAISFPDMEKALSHIRSTGTFPPFLESKEDRNTIGKCPVTETQIASAKAKVTKWLQPGHPGSLIFPPRSSSKSPANDQESPPLGGGRGPRLCLLDGFLLYSPHLLPPQIISSLLDIKLFLLVSKQKATKRREARDGYVTLEGFWTDPPGYVEKIVWPNYVASHKWLFKDGDVEAGVLDEDAMRRYGILAPVGKGMDVPFEETLDCAVGSIMVELERIYLHSEKKKEGEEGDRKHKDNRRQ